MIWILAAAAQSVVLESVRIVDASGVRHAEVVVVEDGRISWVGKDEHRWPEARRVSIDGKTLIPGLVDAHVHLSMVPGSAFRTRSAAEEEQRWAHHLRAFVACGVTTVLDTGITPQNAERLLALKGPSPAIRLLGPLISPPGGYLSAVIPEFEATPDVQTLTRQLEGFDRFDPIGVKVTMEDGMVRPIWPLQLSEIREALNDQHRPLFVHALDRAMVDEALQTLDVHAFVHPPDGAEGLASALQDIPVITTLTVFDAMLTPRTPERLDDSLLQLVVPADERAALRDKKRIRASNIAVLRGVMPRLPGVIRGPIAGMLTAKKPIQKRLDRIGAGLLQLHSNGVELVLGSDSGNWPVFLVYLHGVSTIREMEVLQEQGFKPQDILRFATLNGASLLGMQDEIGSVQVGKRASLVVVNQDPIVDIAALRDVAWVLHDGRMATPAEWMELR